MSSVKRMTELACTFLLLLTAATARADGPLFSIWHIDGHGYAWQQAQTAAGLPIEGTVRMPSEHEHYLNHPQILAQLDANAPILSQLNGREIVLRMHNITNEIDWTLPRIVPTEANHQTSHNCVRRLPNGALDTTPQLSPWAGMAAWAETGRRWAISAWVARLQQVIPNPTSLILRDNNEGPKLLLDDLYVQQRVYFARTQDGARRFAEPETPRTAWTDVNLVPLGPEWLLMSSAPENVVAFRWLTADEMDAIDIRAKDWFVTRRDKKPQEVLPEYSALIASQYQALFDGFRDNLSPVWKAAWKGCVGYKSDPYHNSESPACYTNYYADRPASLCHPQWAVYRDRVVASQQSKSWREISIRMNGQTMYQSVLDGTGAIVDADSYACFNVHWAWALQAAGTPVRLVWWDNYNTPTTQLIPASQTYKDKLIQLGRADLTTLTIEQCEVAVMQRLKQIHDHPILSEYWRRGTTRIMSSPLNTSTVTKVYATETTIPGVTAKLVCVYTPCDLPGLIQVEGLLLPAKRLAYYVTPGLQEIQ